MPYPKSAEQFERMPPLPVYKLGQRKYMRFVPESSKHS